MAMTQEERISSEEKLLKLIENPGDIKKGGTAGIKKQGTNLPFFNNLRDVFKDLKIK